MFPHNADDSEYFVEWLISHWGIVPRLVVLLRNAGNAEKLVEIIVGDSNKYLPIKPQCDEKIPQYVERISRLLDPFYFVGYTPQNDLE